MRNESKVSVASLVICIVLGNLALVACMGVANANPIAVELGFALSAENVTVDVYRSESRITGDYTFLRIARPRRNREDSEYDGFGVGTNGLHRRRPPSPAIIDCGISLIVPIILPTNGVTIDTELAQKPELREKFLKDSMQARLALVKPLGTVDGQDFPIGPLPFSVPLSPWDEIRKVQSQLPEGWEFVLFRGYREADRSRREIDLHLSYTQPHFPGNVSAYLSILPQGDIVKSHYLITFQAHDGVRLSQAAHYDVVGKASDTVLSVRPVHLQLLQVQVK